VGGGVRPQTDEPRDSAHLPGSTESNSTNVRNGHQTKEVKGSYHLLCVGVAQGSGDEEKVYGDDLAS